MNYCKAFTFLYLSYFVNGAFANINLAPIEKQYINGVYQLELKNYVSAIDYCANGLNLLGNNYYYPELEDDSEMKLTLAKVSLAKGEKSVSASLYCGVLESRINAYKVKSKYTKKA